MPDLVPRPMRMLARKRKNIRLSPIQRKSTMGLWETGPGWPPASSRHTASLTVCTQKRLSNQQPYTPEDFRRGSSSLPFPNDRSPMNFRDEFPEISNLFSAAWKRFRCAESDVRPHRGELGSRSLDVRNAEASVEWERVSKKFSSRGNCNCNSCGQLNLRKTKWRITTETESASVKYRYF